MNSYVDLLLLKCSSSKENYEQAKEVANCKCDEEGKLKLNIINSKANSFKNANKFVRRLDLYIIYKNLFQTS